MRRLVDTLILLLVAYTITWPLVRSWAGGDEQMSSLVVEVRGLRAPAATVSIATEADSARRSEWVAVAEFHRDGDSPVIPQLGARDSVWVLVEVDRMSVPPYELAVDRSSLPPRLVVDLPFRLETDDGSRFEVAPASSTANETK
ncbi:MAG: hypothetical protein HZB39_18085 [Planctomycetes bacterium]|nr:hypothetical protein [Planctomycetota bacterium]